MRRKILLTLCLTLLIVLAFSGCVETNEDSNNGDTNDDNNAGGLTGTATYSGIWSGSLQEMGDINGTWEYIVDFDQGTVTGWFKGDAAGDVSGNVSDGVVEASGDAAFGTVSWSGSFSSDGEEVSGTWEYLGGDGSGSWNGSKGKASEDGTENNEEDGDDIETADSLKYSVEVTSEGETRSATWKAKNIGTDNMKMRLEGTEGEENFGWILDGENRRLWTLTDDVWEEIELPSEEYWVSYWNTWKSAFDGYHTALSSWTGGEYTYTDGEGNQVRIFDIEINPTLSDSQFEP